MSKLLLEKFPGREVVRGGAESLPFADASFDTCIATLVLCSVRDLNRTLSEITRVLRPGGKFLFLEHIAAPRKTLARALQPIVYWPWRCLGDGCRTNRDSLAAIQSHFTQVDAETYWAPPWSVPLWVRYQVVGCARKQAP
jgi:ubiquinone/menaquinone biosynthesis C-methylase UbiE